MTASLFELPRTPAERTVSLMNTAKAYAAARERLQASTEALSRARLNRCSSVAKRSDEVDAAVEAVSAAQGAISELVSSLASDGSLETLSELLAAETAGRP